MTHEADVIGDRAHFVNGQCRRASVEDLGQAAAESLQQHPDHAIITSFPGLADSTGARVFAELATTAPDSSMPGVEGLRRIRARHPGLGALHLQHRSPHQKQPPRRRRLDLAFAAVANCPSARSMNRAGENTAIAIRRGPGAAGARRGQVSRGRQPRRASDNSR